MPGQSLMPIASEKAVRVYMLTLVHTLSSCRCCDISCGVGQWSCSPEWERGSAPGPAGRAAGVLVPHLASVSKHVDALKSPPSCPVLALASCSPWALEKASPKPGYILAMATPSPCLRETSFLVLLVCPHTAHAVGRHCGLLSSSSWAPQLSLPGPGCVCWAPGSSCASTPR